jgi:hypothetical protein
VVVIVAHKKKTPTEPKFKRALKVQREETTGRNEKTREPCGWRADFGRNLAVLIRKYRKTDY